ncbi:MAG: hypothetical protein UR12_C0001G0027 [candidate division TM6 bacterium GW2011_GWF2_30_66]|nr:MAG: hypothetical protein UR12_C0001G0027 [candidate division TM6 bacterium GW2011_GWF2_30_66]
MLYSKVKKHTKKTFLYLWSLFLSGLFTILPLTFTVVFLNFSFKLLIKWLEPIRMIEPNFIKHIPYSEVFLTILSIFLIGIILKVFILKRIIHAIEKLIYKIPLIRPIYKGLKQMVDSFYSDKKTASFTNVVLIEFPRKEIYSIGFSTGELPEELSPEKNQPYLNVFIPTSPNPTTGFYLIVPEKDLLKTELTKQEAMAIIMSGGIIIPDRFTKKT